MYCIRIPLESICLVSFDISWQRIEREYILKGDWSWNIADAKPTKPPIKELQSPAAPSRISALERIDTVFRVVYQDGHRPELPRNGSASRSTGGGTDSNPLNGNTVTGIGLFHGSQAHFFSPQNVFASWSLTEVSYRIGSVS